MTLRKPIRRSDGNNLPNSNVILQCRLLRPISLQDLLTPTSLQLNSILQPLIKRRGEHLDWFPLMDRRMFACTM